MYVSREERGSGGDETTSSIILKTDRPGREDRGRLGDPEGRGGLGGIPPVRAPKGGKGGDRMWQTEGGLGGVGSILCRIFACGAILTQNLPW